MRRAAGAALLLGVLLHWCDGCPSPSANGIRPKRPVRFPTRSALLVRGGAAAGNPLLPPRAGAPAIPGRPGDISIPPPAKKKAEGESDAGAESNAESADAGAESVVDAGAESVSDAGAESDADAGAESVADAGAESVADAGAESVAEAGAESEDAVDAESEDAVDAESDGAAATEGGAKNESSSLPVRVAPAPSRRRWTRFLSRLTAREVVISRSTAGVSLAMVLGWAAQALQRRAAAAEAKRRATRRAETRQRLAEAATATDGATANRAPADGSLGDGASTALRSRAHPIELATSSMAVKRPQLVDGEYDPAAPTLAAVAPGIRLRRCIAKAYRSSPLRPRARKRLSWRTIVASSVAVGAGVACIQGGVGALGALATCLGLDSADEGRIQGGRIQGQRIQGGLAFVQARVGRDSRAVAGVFGDGDDDDDDDNNDDDDGDYFDDDDDDDDDGIHSPHPLRTAEWQITVVPRLWSRARWGKPPWHSSRRCERAPGSWNRRRGA